MVTWKWKCDICNDIVVSDSREKHTMNYCRCKLSAVDLEEDYSREIGAVHIIKMKK